MGVFANLFKGLKKTKEAFSSFLSSLFKGGYSGADFYDELEFALISADVGVKASAEIVQKLKERVNEEKIKDPGFVKQKLREIIKETVGRADLEIRYPCVIMIVGVNGTGKTTTIGKLANYFVKNRKSVCIAAGDTFRAAASGQLSVWAQRAGVRFISQGEGADPSAVVFDAIVSAKAKKTDVLIIDTAGRLHNKANLMEELKKMNRIILREYPESFKYNFIVLDATTGQNALMQTRAFNEAVKLDGIILTKLDGTAKGGIVIAINAESGIPVTFIGTGEKIDDIEPFDAEAFADSII
jgi:fused signal recognition particle receptor